MSIEHTNNYDIGTSIEHINNYDIGTSIEHYCINIYELKIDT